MKCIECGGAMKKIQGDYRYLESGLDDIVLGNITRYKCSKCGEEEVAIPSTDDLHKLIAFILILKPTPLMGKEVKYLRKMLGYTSEKFAEALGVTRVSISRWENSGLEMKPDRDKHIRLFFFSKKSDEMQKSPSVMLVIKTLVSNLPMKEDNREIRFQPEDWTAMAGA